MEREAQMRRMSTTGVNTDKTLEDAFKRYASEVSIRKPGADWEAKRLIQSRRTRSRVFDQAA